MVHHDIFSPAMSHYDMEHHYISNVNRVDISCSFFSQFYSFHLGFMLIGNRGSTCFSGVWRPDQLPICVEGIDQLPKKKNFVLK